MFEKGVELVQRTELLRFVCSVRCSWVPFSLQPWVSYHHDFDLLPVLCVRCGICFQPCLQDVARGILEAECVGHRDPSSWVCSLDGAMDQSSRSSKRFPLTIGPSF